MYIYTYGGNLIYRAFPYTRIPIYIYMYILIQLRESYRTLSPLSNPKRHWSTEYTIPFYIILYCLYSTGLYHTEIPIYRAHL